MTNLTKSFDDALARLREAVEAGTTPGGVLGVGVGRTVEGVAALGSAETGEHTRPVTEETYFDVASLTKVAATLPVVLGLIADGRLTLESRVVEVLPDFAHGTASPNGSEQRSAVTVEHLLTHTSGLPSHSELWRLGLEPDALRRRFVTAPLSTPPGTHVEYSSVGFMVLGWMVEGLTGKGLDVLLSEYVTEPLGLRHTSFGPLSGDIAATERGTDGRYRVGVVHDENAAALGTATGHAGLFSTAGDLASYLAAWTNPKEDWLPVHLRCASVRDRTASLDGHRGLGWTARHDRYDQLGPAWPDSAVFHSGFTGTSLALDPPSERWVVLLTNDVHFGRGRGWMNALRHAVHTPLAPCR